MTKTLRCSLRGRFFEKSTANLEEPEAAVKEGGEEGAAIRDCLNEAAAQSELIPTVAALMQTLRTHNAADPVGDMDDITAQSLRDLIMKTKLQNELHEGPEVSEQDVMDEFEVSREMTQAAVTGSTLTKSWWEEGSVYKFKKYPHVVPPLKIGQRRKVYIWYCDIPFPDELDVGNGQVQISIDASPPGTQHPSMFAMDPKGDEDIACRLAFQVAVKGADGKSFIYKPHQSRRKAVAKANTLTDMLVNRTPLQELAKIPARCLFFKKGKAPEGLKQFEGGSYTSLGC